MTRAATRALDAVHRACAAVAGAILAAIVAAIAANVAARNLAGAPIFGLLDLVEYGLLLVTLLGAPWVLSLRGHVVVDLATGAASPAWRRRLARFSAAIGLAASAVLAFYALQAVLAAHARGSAIRTAFVVPEWWVLSVMPASLTLIAAEFARQIARPDPPRDRTGGGAAGL